MRADGRRSMMISPLRAFDAHYGGQASCQKTFQRFPPLCRLRERAMPPASRQYFDALSLNGPYCSIFALGHFHSPRTPYRYMFRYKMLPAYFARYRFSHIIELGLHRQYKIATWYDFYALRLLYFARFSLRRAFFIKPMWFDFGFWYEYSRERRIWHRRMLLKYSALQLAAGILRKRYTDFNTRYSDRYWHLYMPRILLHDITLLIYDNWILASASPATLVHAAMGHMILQVALLIHFKYHHVLNFIFLLKGEKW